MKTVLSWSASYLLCLCLFQTAPVLAQDTPADGQGYVRIQGAKVKQEDTGPGIMDEELIDFPEEMRTFIENIARFSHDIRPTFGIIVEDALSLLAKTDSLDETLLMPAKAYTRSINGIMPTALFHGMTSYAQPNDQTYLAADDDLGLVARAQEAGLPVFLVDKTDDPAQIAGGYARATELDFHYSSMTASDFDVSALPDFPARPYEENAANIFSLGAVKNFAVIGNSSVYGREDEFALRMKRNNYDLLVVDVFHGLEPLSKRAVETLKYKRNGARRLVYARVKIGTAAKYLYYWQDGWREGFPAWLGRPLPDNEDVHYVKYWQPEWQRIVSGDTASYIYGAIDQGYDGVVLADVDIFHAFDDGIEIP